MNELMKGERKFCFEYELSGWNESNVKAEKQKQKTLGKRCERLKIPEFAQRNFSGKA